MNPQLLFNIAELALSLAKGQTTGNVRDHAAAAETLMEIIRKSAEAYKQHTGELLDPSLIRAEEPV
jgi:hypothetical protein